MKIFRNFMLNSCTHAMKNRKKNTCSTRCQEMFMSVTSVILLKLGSQDFHIHPFLLQATLYFAQTRCKASVCR